MKSLTAMEKRPGTPEVIRLLPLLMVGMGVLAYANSFAGVFLLDDHIRIVNEPYVRTVLPIRWGFRELVNLTFKLNYVVGGLRAADFHLLNLGFHVAAGLLLYGVIRRTLGLVTVSVCDTARSRVLAFLCASAWLIHPLQTESVTYMCQRYEVMMGMFLFATLYCFVRGASLETRRSDGWWHGASIGACALGMACKETMVAAPLVVLLYDYVFVSRSWLQIMKRRKTYYLGMAMTYGVLAILLARTRASAAADGLYLVSRLSPWRYLGTQFGVVAHYVRLALVPYPLCFDYGWPVATRWWEILPGAVFLAPMAVISLWLFFRRRPAGFLGAWFFLTLAPTSSVLPLDDIAFEHRMYLPLAAVTGSVVFGLHAAVRRRSTADRAFGRMTVVLLTVVAGLAMLTSARNTAYHSVSGMWGDVVRNCPSNLRARNDLAVALSEEGRAGEAEAEYEHVLRLTRHATRPFQVGETADQASPRYNRYRALMNYGLLRYQSGEMPEAAALYAEALRLSPGSGVARVGLERCRRESDE